jgi:hypothetical protein
LLLCTALVPALSFAQQTEAPVASWNIYELKLVQIQDEPGTPSAYQVGYSVFRTRKALFGYEVLQKFCAERGIKLETVRRP